MRRFWIVLERILSNSKDRAGVHRAGPRAGRNSRVLSDLPLQVHEATTEGREIWRPCLCSAYQEYEVSRRLYV